MLKLLQTLSKVTDKKIPDKFNETNYKNIIKMKVKMNMCSKYLLYRSGLEAPLL